MRPEGDRERAAVLALMAAGEIPWDQLGGVIEEEGGALSALARRAADRIFDVDERRLTLDQLEDRIHAWETEGVALLTVLDASYPPNLRTVYNRPAALFIRGSLSDADERSVAVVGTRSASPEGLARARALAAGLAGAGYTVISGLAAGVEDAAHMGALDAGGRSVAVIGTGVREAFARSDAAMRARLAKQSAVISAVWPDQGARNWTFRQQGAVMSGLARGIVVVEAGHTSGARIQARLALEHGRPVFLLRSLLSRAWAREMAGRPAVYVVDGATEIVDTLERLYADELALNS